MKKDKIVRDPHGVIIEEHLFDPLRDIAEVSPNGAIDLKKAITDGIIPTSVEGLGENFNNIEEAEGIFGKPRDVFEAESMGEMLAERLPKSSESSEKSENQS